MQDIVVDPEFQSLIPPMTSDELSGLREGVLRDGCLDPLVVWDETNILLDGHNRLQICTDANLPFTTRRLCFDDRDAAKAWVIQHQFGRRNLTPFQRAELALTLEPLIAEKAKANVRAGGGSGVSGRQNSDNPIDTKKELAKVAGVSHDTIARAKVIAEKADEETKEKLRRGETSINAVFTELRKPHVANNSGENEWYTPPQYIAAATAVMGAIDCDPASSNAANKTVCAATYYTADDDGRLQRWGQRVWMNPPYAQPLCGEFCELLATKVESGEVEQAIVLVNNATETTWFHRLVSVASAVCFTKGRVKFLDPEGNPGAPLQGQAAVYVGRNVDGFVHEFATFGWCALVEGGRQ